LRTTFSRNTSSSASFAWYSKRSHVRRRAGPAEYRRTPASPTHTSKVPTRAASAAAAVRHARAGLQHDAGNPTDRDVCEHRSHSQALLIHAHESAINDIDFTPFHEDDRQTLLDQDGFERWQHCVSWLSGRT
jgi:hypothetical protein